MKWRVKAGNWPYYSVQKLCLHDSSPRFWKLPSANDLLGRRMSRLRSEQLLVLRIETILHGGWTTSWSTAWRCGKGEYYHIIIFLGSILHFTSTKKTSEDLRNGTFQHHYLPKIRICYQAASMIAVWLWNLISYSKERMGAQSIWE